MPKHLGKGVRFSKVIYSFALDKNVVPMYKNMLPVLRGQHGKALYIILKPVFLFKTIIFISEVVRVG